MHIRPPYTSRRAGQWRMPSFIDSPRPVGRASAQSLAALLAKVEARTRAAITLCVTDAEGREIDIDLPGQFPVNPQIKGAIKATHGVLAVEEI